MVLSDGIKQIEDEIGLLTWTTSMLNILWKMLNLFAATGHITYTKSTQLYLQQTSKLPKTHLWLYNEFVNGNLTAQRTKGDWTGIWTDLAVERTMMQSINSREGLTGGRGMTESVRDMWALSLSQIASVHNVMI